MLIRPFGFLGLLKILLDHGGFFKVSLFKLDTPLPACLFSADCVPCSSPATVVVSFASTAPCILFASDLQIDEKLKCWKPVCFKGLEAFGSFAHARISAFFYIPPSSPIVTRRHCSTEPAVPMKRFSLEPALTYFTRHVGHMY